MHDSTPAGAVGIENVGHEYQVLFYEDPAEARFRHRCDRGPRGVIICAPLLGEGHTITREPLTISPSIWCQDCGTHGFVRFGMWEAA